MPCVPSTKRPSCPDDLGPLNPGGVGFMERGTPTCHEAGEMGIPEPRTQGHVDSGRGCFLRACPPPSREHGRPALFAQGLKGL